MPLQAALSSPQDPALSAKMRALRERLQALDDRIDSAQTTGWKQDLQRFQSSSLGGPEAFATLNTGRATFPPASIDGLLPSAGGGPSSSFSALTALTATRSVIAAKEVEQRLGAILLLQRAMRRFIRRKQARDERRRLLRQRWVDRREAAAKFVQKIARGFLIRKVMKLARATAAAHAEKNDWLSPSGPGAKLYAALQIKTKERCDAEEAMREKAWALVFGSGSSGNNNDSNTGTIEGLKVSSRVLDKAQQDLEKSKDKSKDGNDDENEKSEEAGGIGQIGQASRDRPGEQQHVPIALSSLADSASYALALPSALIARSFPQTFTATIEGSNTGAVGVFRLPKVITLKSNKKQQDAAVTKAPPPPPPRPEHRYSINRAEPAEEKDKERGGELLLAALRMKAAELVATVTEEQVDFHYRHGAEGEGEGEGEEEQEQEQEIASSSFEVSAETAETTTEVHPLLQPPPEVMLRSSAAATGVAVTAAARVARVGPLSAIDRVLDSLEQQGMKQQQQEGQEEQGGQEQEQSTVQRFHPMMLLPSAQAAVAALGAPGPAPPPSSSFATFHPSTGGPTGTARLTQEEYAAAAIIAEQANSGGASPTRLLLLASQASQLPRSPATLENSNSSSLGTALAAVPVVVPLRSLSPGLHQAAAGAWMDATKGPASASASVVPESTNAAAPVPAPAPAPALLASYDFESVRAELRAIAERVLRQQSPQPPQPLHSAHMQPPQESQAEVSAYAADLFLNSNESGSRAASPPTHELDASPAAPAEGAGASSSLTAEPAVVLMVPLASASASASSEPPSSQQASATSSATATATTRSRPPPLRLQQDVWQQRSSSRSTSSGPVNSASSVGAGGVRGPSHFGGSSSSSLGSSLASSSPFSPSPPPPLPSSESINAANARAGGVGSRGASQGLSVSASFLPLLPPSLGGTPTVYSGNGAGAARLSVLPPLPPASTSTVFISQYLANNNHQNQQQQQQERQRPYASSSFDGLDEAGLEEAEAEAEGEEGATTNTTTTTYAQEALRSLLRPRQQQQPPAQPRQQLQHQQQPQPQVPALSAAPAQDLSVARRFNAREFLLLSRPQQAEPQAAAVSSVASSNTAGSAAPIEEEEASANAISEAAKEQEEEDAEEERAAATPVLSRAVSGGGPSSLDESDATTATRNDSEDGNGNGGDEDDDDDLDRLYRQYGRRLSDHSAVVAGYRSSMALFLNSSGGGSSGGGSNHTSPAGTARSGLADPTGLSSQAAHLPASGRSSVASLSGRSASNLGSPAISPRGGTSSARNSAAAGAGATISSPVEQSRLSLSQLQTSPGPAHGHHHHRSSSSINSSSSHYYQSGLDAIPEATPATNPSSSSSSSSSAAMTPVLSGAAGMLPSTAEEEEQGLGDGHNRSGAFKADEHRKQEGKTIPTLHLQPLVPSLVPQASPLTAAHESEMQPAVVRVAPSNTTKVVVVAAGLTARAEEHSTTAAAAGHPATHHHQASFSSKAAAPRSSSGSGNAAAAKTAPPPPPPRPVLQPAATVDSANTSDSEEDDSVHAFADDDAAAPSSMKGHY